MTTIYRRLRIGSTIFIVLLVISTIACAETKKLGCEWGRDIDNGSITQFHLTNSPLVTHASRNGKPSVTRTDVPAGATVKILGSKPQSIKKDIPVFPTIPFTFKLMTVLGSGQMTQFHAPGDVSGPCSATATW